MANNLLQAGLPPCVPVSEPQVEIVGQNQAPSGSNEPSIDFGFGALRNQASEMMDKLMKDEPAEPVEAASTDKVVETPVKEVAEPQEPQAPEPLSLTDDQLVRVVVDGEEKILPWKDARGNISGGLKFTQNSQKLAQDRKAFEAEQQKLQQYETERTQLQAFLKDKSALEAYFKKAFGEQQTAQAAAFGDPNEIATVEQAQKIAQAQTQEIVARLAALQQETDQKILTSKQEIAFMQEKSLHDKAIHSTLAEIFTANPVLKAIPHSEDLLRFEVSNLQPQTQEEALAGFHQVAKGLVEELGKHFKEQSKLAKVTETKQKLASKSIEPAGGAAPQTKPTNFKSADGTVDWKKVKQAASDFLS